MMLLFPSVFFKTWFRISMTVLLKVLKKLLYVIGSRARKNLHLISETGRFNGVGRYRREYQPTEILHQLNFSYDQNLI